MLAHVVNTEIHVLNRDPCPASYYFTSNLDNIIPFHNRSQLEQYNVCMTPLSFHTARSPGQSSPKSSQSWRLFSDRLGKPGWISEKAGGSALEFPVSFGALPAMSVTYLRTYENIGTAEFSIDAMETGYLF